MAFTASKAAVTVSAGLVTTGPVCTAAISNDNHRPDARTQPVQRPSGRGSSSQIPARIDHDVMSGDVTSHVRNEK